MIIHELQQNNEIDSYLKKNMPTINEENEENVEELKEEEIKVNELASMLHKVILASHGMGK